MHEILLQGRKRWKGVRTICSLPKKKHVQIALQSKEMYAENGDPFLTNPEGTRKYHINTIHPHFEKELNKNKNKRCSVSGMTSAGEEIQYYLVLDYVVLELRVIEKNARYGNRSVLNLKQKFHTCKRTFEKKITGFRNDVNRVCESTRYLTPCNCKKNGTGLLFVRILLVYTLIIVPMKRNASGMTSTDVKVQHGKVLSCVWWEENLKSTRALKSYDADVGGCCGVPPCSLWAAPLVFLSALAAIARSDDRRWLADPRRSQSRIIDRLSRSPTLKWKKTWFRGGNKPETRQNISISLQPAQGTAVIVHRNHWHWYKEMLYIHGQLGQ